MGKIFTRSKTASVILLVFVLVGLQACDRLRNYSEQELLQRAKNFQNKGDLKASVIELKNALQKNPNNVEARWLLGESYIKTGQGSEAEKELQKAHQLGVSEESIMPSLGQALLLQGQYTRVLDEIKVGSAASSKSMAKIQQIRGEAQLSLGHFEEGCALFNASRETDAGYVPAYRGLAKCAAVKGDIEGAKSLLDNALKLDGMDVVTWVLLGDFERERNNLQAAEDAYLKARKIDANNVGAFLGMTSVYSGKGDYGKAANEIRSARKAWPNNLIIQYAQAYVLFKQKKFTEARDVLQQVLKIMPDHMPSILLSGEVSFALGAYEKAASDLNGYLTQFPGNIVARRMLAATYLETGRADLALKILNPILTENTKKDALLLALAGEAYKALGAYDKATEYLEKAIAIEPKNIGGHIELAMSQLAKGDAERAVSELEAAAALDPAQYKANIALVQIYLSKKQFDKALQSIEALEKKQPKNPVTFNLKGVAYLGKNDFINARKSFEQALALDPSNISSSINLAQLDLKDKRPEAARKRFEDILQKDKLNMQAMLMLANLAVKSGKEQEYVSWLEKAAKANPSALQPLALLANYYVQKKEPQKALRVAHEAQSANPQNPEALDLLGSVQFAFGDKDNALVTYNKLVQLTPRSPVAYYKLASVQSATKNNAQVRISINKALELKPDYLEAQTALIFLEMEEGKLGEAVKIAQIIQRQSPKSPVGFALEGDVLMAQKKYAEATNAYKGAMLLSQNGLFAVKVHLAQSLAGDLKGADGVLLQWLKKYPDDVIVRGHLAQTYMQAGRNKQAIEEYELMLQKTPNGVSLLNNLALLYYQEKDPRALPIAEKAYKLSPNNVSVMDTLGWILTEQGNLVRGVEILQKAATAAPKNLDIGYHYAVALAKSGDKLKARKQLEILLAPGQTFPKIEQARTLLKQL